MSFTLAFKDKKTFKPIDRLIVIIEIEPRSKNSYTLPHKMSDSNGRVTYRTEDVANTIKSSVGECIMDYDGNLYGCTGRIFPHLYSKKELLCRSVRLSAWDVKAAIDLSRIVKSSSNDEHRAISVGWIEATPPFRWNDINETVVLEIEMIS